MQSRDLDIQYTATAVSTGGRNGEGGKTNPEQLFAAGYAACFSSSAKLAAETMNLDINPDDLKVTCHVSLGKDKQENGFGLKIKMEMDVKGLEQDAKQRLLEKANDLCPYSKAIRGNVDVELTVK